MHCRGFVVCNHSRHPVSTCWLFFQDNMDQHTPQLHKLASATDINCKPPANLCCFSPCRQLAASEKRVERAMTESRSARAGYSGEEYDAWD